MCTDTIHASACLKPREFQHLGAPNISEAHPPRDVQVCTHVHLCFSCVQYVHVCRVCVGLLSRRFKPLHQQVMHERIRYICAAEGVQCEGEALDTLSRVSAGDLRRAITTLQSAVRLAGPTVSRCAQLRPLSQVSPVPLHAACPFMSATKRRSRLVILCKVVRHMSPQQ